MFVPLGSPGTPPTSESLTQLLQGQGELGRWSSTVKEALVCPATGEVLVVADVHGQGESLEMSEEQLMQRLRERKALEQQQVEEQEQQARSTAAAAGQDEPTKVCQSQD